MSAAQWRKAMNFSESGRNRSGRTSGRARFVGREIPSAGTRSCSAGQCRPRRLGRHIRWRHVIVLAAVLVYPWIASPFFTYQIGAQALALGLIALSLTFLAGYGGMLSLAQMTVAGIAGYIVAILGGAARRKSASAGRGGWW